METLQNRYNREYKAVAQALSDWVESSVINTSAPFDLLIFTLIDTADAFNRGLLAAIYPIHVRIFQDWSESSNPLEFFDNLERLGE